MTVNDAPCSECSKVLFVPCESFNVKLAFVSSDCKCCLYMYCMHYSDLNACMTVCVHNNCMFIHVCEMGLYMQCMLAYAPWNV